MSEPSRAVFAHFLPITVKWGEMDNLGHVNNTVYFRYAEDGRIDYFMAMTGRDTEYGAEAAGPILASIQCDFREQLRYPADVEIATRVARLGGASMDVEQALFVAGRPTLIAIFETAVVWFDFAKQTSAPMEVTMREKVRAFEVVAPNE